MYPNFYWLSVNVHDVRKEFPLPTRKWKILSKCLLLLPVPHAHLSDKLHVYVNNTELSLKPIFSGASGGGGSSL